MVSLETLAMSEMQTINLLIHFFVFQFGMLNKFEAQSLKAEFQEGLKGCS